MGLLPNTYFGGWSFRFRYLQTKYVDGHGSKLLVGIYFQENKLKTAMNWHFYIIRDNHKILEESGVVALDNSYKK